MFVIIIRVLICRRFSFAAIPFVCVCVHHVIDSRFPVRAGGQEVNAPVARRRASIKIDEKLAVRFLFLSFCHFSTHFYYQF